MSDEQKPTTEETPTEATPAETEAVVEAPAEATPETEAPAVEAAAPEAPADAEVKVVPFSELKSGMTIRLHERISDVSPKGEKRERTQVFEGIILNIRGSQDSRSMTIRKVSNGVGVEKIFPLSSPNLVKVEVVKVAKTRRGNLSFIAGFRRKLKETWMK